MGYYDNAKKELEETIRRIEHKRNELKEYSDNIRKDLANILKGIEVKIAYASKQQEKVDYSLSHAKFLHSGAQKSLQERQKGFPWLAKSLSELESVNDRIIEQGLILKKRPAKAASLVVKKQNKLRREAEQKLKVAENLILYYENIAPFLIDLKEEEIDTVDEHQSIYQDYTDQERQDKTTDYLTKEEYRNLPSDQKNQIALDRYWSRKKTKAQIGRIYERYIGYIFEQKGYDVTYEGIIKGLEDLGRDLICKKGDELVVIQCKYWSKFKTIYEKHIFQFFGTVYQLKKSNPELNVSGAFYTSTNLSDFAREFSQELGIDLKENISLDKSYPIIKCHINKTTNTKIYHLPFDQQYDKINMSRHKDSFYCKTIKEAEALGFRRAYKYKGLVKLGS